MGGSPCCLRVSRCLLVLGQHFDRMRNTSLILVVSAASVCAQTVNTQVDGVVLTNRLVSLSDDSAVAAGADRATGVGYLTDDDATTFVFNAGLGSDALPISNAALEGDFNGPVSASATGLFIVSVMGGEGVSSGQFDVQLRLLTGLTNAINLNENNFTINWQFVSSGLVYQNFNGSLEPASDFGFAYAYLPYSALGIADGSGLLGVKLSNFSSTWLEVGYIGMGYFSAPVPEPSTYGLAIGSLALACAALRRRRKA